MRVLVVDDEEVMQRVMRRALSAAGHTTHPAKSADAALETADRFDAAIVDVHIAPNDGIALAKKLLAENRVGRVVFFTGSTDQSVLRAAANLGAVVHKAHGSLQDVIEKLEAQ